MPSVAMHTAQPLLLPLCSFVRSRGIPRCKDAFFGKKQETEDMLQGGLGRERGDRKSNGRWESREEKTMRGAGGPFAATFTSHVCLVITSDLAAYWITSSFLGGQ